jgi:dienelactone hydrolase
MKTFCLAVALCFAAGTAGASAATAAGFPHKDFSFASADGTVLSGTLSWPSDLEDGQQAATFVTIGEAPGDPAIAAIATALNSAGYAVMQYDRRRTSRQNDADDAAAAIRAVDSDAHVDPKHVFLLAHGDGGEVAMAVAIATGIQVRGLVLLAASSNRLTDVDPSGEIALVPQPILMLHGSADARVSDDDEARLSAAAHAAGLKFTYGQLGGDDHAFSTVAGAERLDSRVVAAIVAWLQEV